MNIKNLSNVRTVAAVGVMAATLECGKLVLSFLPNVEVVSILCALFGYVFGPAGVVASFIFVLIEPLIWGFGPWFITYLIYWPCLTALFMLLGRRNAKGRIKITLVAVGMTFLFGILSSVIDCGMYIGFNRYYFKNLPLYYIRGLSFYITQIACNAVLFFSVFLLLADRLGMIKKRMNLDKK